jgi:two-component system LytT family response regulator
MTTRVIIADDESLARKLLREMLSTHADVEVVAEAATGLAAVEEIRRHEPDVVFLDVQMPELDGFAVVETLPGDPPAIVFVTAYDRYAVRAFDVDALDYLLKPFDSERLGHALEKARQRLEAKDTKRAAAAATRIAEERHRPESSRTRLPVHVDGAVRFIDLASIDWIEVEGKTLRIHRGRDHITTRQTLSDVEELLRGLHGADFVRVHRSALVNVAAIHEIQPWFHGDYVLLLRNGAKVTTGRSYRDAVRALMSPER